MYKRFSTLLLCAALLTGCLGGFHAPSPPPRSAFMPTEAVSTASSQQLKTMTPLELQSAVMAFADTASAQLTEASHVLEDIGTPQARLTAARMMVFDVGSNVEIAAGPYPGIALLDMVVLSSLRRMVWEEYWIPHRFGRQAQPALDVFREIEEDIWTLAAKIIPPQQLDELANIILRWRKKHPKQISVNYVRFDDFGELGLKPSMRKLTVPGGLFSSVKEATLIAQDMKVSIDRAFYLMSRLQLIVNFQIKLAYLEMLFQPETDGMIDTSKEIAGIGERWAEVVEKLPIQMGGEANKLVQQLFVHLDQNTSKTLHEITMWQDQVLKEVMTDISKEREAAINQTLQGLLEQQKVLFTQVNSLVDDSGREMESTMEATLNHAFLLGLLLIAAFFAALTLYKILVARPIDRKRGK